MARYAALQARRTPVVPPLYRLGRLSASESFANGRVPFLMAYDWPQGAAVGTNPPKPASCRLPTTGQKLKTFTVPVVGRSAK